MKIKILVVAITVIVLTVLSAAGFFIYQNLIKSEIKEEEETPAIVGEEIKTEEESGIKNKEVLKETRLLKDDFEIILPPGWQEATTSAEGILAIAIDAKEDISGGNFQKLDFRTNLAVKSDDITKYASINSLEEYVASVKTSLIQTISGITFDKEEQKTINGHQAIVIECESTQEETDFKTLLVFVMGNDNTIYAISFNTFQDSWPAYQDLFYWIAESFKLQYKIEL